MRCARTESHGSRTAITALCVPASYGQPETFFQTCDFAEVPVSRQLFQYESRKIKRERKIKWSGRKDLNLRPPGPEPGALARLRYAPTQHDASKHRAFVRNTRIAQPMGPYQELSGRRSPGNKPRLITQMAILNIVAICAMKQIQSTAGSDPCLT